MSADSRGAVIAMPGIHASYHGDNSNGSGRGFPLEPPLPHQFQLSRFRPIQMDRCTAPACLHVPYHTRVAHQEPNFPATLYSDDYRGNPTLTCVFDPYTYFQRNAAQDIHFANSLVEYGKATAWPPTAPTSGHSYSVCQVGPLQHPEVHHFNNQGVAPEQQKLNKKESSLSVVGPHCRVLSVDVNTSEFEAFDDDAPSKCEGLSPSTIDTDDDSPPTPQTDVGAAAFHYMAPSANPAPVFDSVDHGLPRLSTEFHASTIGLPSVAMMGPGQSLQSSFGPLTEVSTMLPQNMMKENDMNTFDATFRTFTLEGLPTQSGHFDPMPHYAAPNLVLPGPVPTVENRVHSPSSDHSPRAAHDVGDESGTGSVVSEEPIPSTKAAEAKRIRSRQDQFLLDCRRKGMTYREIKRLGGFAEAESTLRGRVRTLTKDANERLRRPQWSENDVKLLFEAVDEHAVSDSHAPLLWKSISDYISAHGGSYKFAAATCARKWKSLN